MRNIWSVTLFILGTLAAADEVDPLPGAAYLKPFKVQLKQALTQGLARGPAQAIDACRIEAPEIAARLSTGGVTVGRASDRLRNPANVAPAWVRPVLEAYLAADGERAPVTVALSETVHGYVEPIAVGGLCLNCHGKTLAPDVRAQLAALYPEDRATGYAAGDFRGVFWVTYPADAGAPAP